ncbi:hypothetical protein ABFV57_10080 [Pseudomonas neuropathica]|uniref:hypothetical protein n=1 Tax=Pseudomonas neuropathica TaxID=2730425 RepID=UPI0034D394E7
MNNNFWGRNSKYAVALMWALLFLSSISWVLVGSVSYWVKNGWLPADSAGWAQAIGGMLAVLVAIVVPAYQSREQQKQLQDKDLKIRADGVQATRALMEHLLGVQKRLRKGLWDYQIRRSSNRPVDDALASAHDAKQAASMLRELSVVALSVEMVHFVVGMREVASYGEFATRTIDNPHAVLSPNTLQALDKNIALLKAWITELDELE